MNEDFVRLAGMTPNAVDAQLEERKIVPGGDENT
jgi:hypothetical protein